MKPIVLGIGSMMSWNRRLWFEIHVLDLLPQEPRVVRVASAPHPSQVGRDVFHFNYSQLKRLVG